MRKIKTSISLEPGCVARLKRLAQRERRSVSQLIDFALEHLIPLLEHRNLDLDGLLPVPAINFPIPKGQGSPATSAIASPKIKEGNPVPPSANPSSGSYPHRVLRVPSSALSTKPTTREATR